MNVMVTPEDRFRDAQRELSNLRMENLDLKEIAAEQEFYICLLELGVNYDDIQSV